VAPGHSVAHSYLTVILDRQLCRSARCPRRRRLRRYAIHGAWEVATLYLDTFGKAPVESLGDRCAGERQATALFYVDEEQVDVGW